MTELILASKSPRRQQLIATLGWPYKVVELSADESIDHPIEASKAAEAIARKKADGYDSMLLSDNQILVTADTVVVHSGKVLGKPHDKAEASAMLHMLSGSAHYVYTGVCLKTRQKSLTFTEETAVYFKQLSDQEIDYYIDTYKPFDKAGSYGIQEWIGMIGIEKIEGCYYNVMGLPTARLYNAIQSLIAE